MMIPFVWSGSENEFRALDPAPTTYWGPWAIASIGDAYAGVFNAPNENIRAHTNPKLSFLPSHGSNMLSDAQVAACGSLKVGIVSGDTLAAAIGKMYEASGASFLDPDRF